MSLLCWNFLHSSGIFQSSGVVDSILAEGNIAWLRKRQGVMAQRADYVNLVAVIPVLECDMDALITSPI